MSGALLCMVFPSVLDSQNKRQGWCQVRRRVTGDDPRTDQNDDEKGVKRAEVSPAKLSWLPGGCLFAGSSVCVSGSWSCGCLLSVPGVGCWVVVSGALVSSLVVGCCPCLPGSSFCSAFRGKGRRPKNRSFRFLTRERLFSGIPMYFGVIVKFCDDLFPLLSASSVWVSSRFRPFLTCRVGSPWRLRVFLFSSRRSLSFAFVLTLLVAGCVSPCKFYVIPTILTVMNRTWVANLAIFRRRRHFVLLLFGPKRTWDQKLSSGWMLPGQLISALTGFDSARVHGHSTLAIIAWSI